MSHINHIADFPDKLNPMLVKELRQGLRGISFVILFIAVQAFLCFILLITAAVASQENTGHLLSRIIFFFFSTAVLIIQPLRGISALASEIRGNTIDLLCLTRLSAWRITYGKWVSIVSQSALILTAIIPYLILRYFFGDMQLFAEVLLLLSIFLVSATFTAFTVGFSGMKSPILRILLPITGAVIVFGFIWNMFFESRFVYQEFLSMFLLNDAPSTLVFLGFICACIYTGWICLDLGTSMIAPVAENRTSLRRIISFSLITTSLLALLLAEVDENTTVILGLLFYTPIAIISLTENHQLVPTIVMPFTRKSLFGKLAGRILYPGWATGLLFFLILIAMLHGLLAYYRSQGTDVQDELVIIVNSLIAAMILPVALTRIFARKNENRFGLFMLFTCSQVLATAIIFACESFSSGLEIMRFFCWLPSSFPYLMDGTSGISRNNMIFISYTNIILYTFIALATSLPVWKHIRDVEREASDYA